MTTRDLASLTLALAPLWMAASCGGASLKGRTTNSIEAACARMAACGFAGVIPTGFGACYDNLIHLQAMPESPASAWKMDFALTSCLAAANSCDEMQACQRPTAAQAASCANTMSDVCSDNHLVTCSRLSSASPLTAFDCSSVGLTCAVGPYGDGTCSLGTCDPSTVTPRCDGDVLVTCSTEYGALVSTDCHQLGQACGTDAAGWGACRGAVACGNSRCDGDVLVSCLAGSESRMDCKEWGSDYTCETDTRPSLSGLSMQTSLLCAPAVRECTTHDDETCDHGVIGYCRRSHRATYDCRSAGLSGCTTTTFGRTIAYCTR